jgi:hypothetical protein
MPWQLLYNELSDIMETNSPYLKKLSNFAQEIWGPGVSEDTQMEMACWLKGIKMWVVKEMVALMPAEKEWGRYDTQNTKRYHFSEMLFHLAFTLSQVDILEARVLGKKPVLMNWAEMSEITAGRTWYKWVFAQIVEKSAIPAYLFSFGHVLFYPVDLVYFVGSWLFRTVASSLNYVQHLWSLGYGFATGFWKNPALELTMLGGYFKAATRQFLDRNQYATFAPTVGGTGATIPRDYKAWVWGFAGMTSSSLLFSGIFLALGGLASWLIPPTGLAMMFMGRSAFAKGLSSYRGWKKYALALGGAAATATGTAMAIAGLPALWTNFFSIAIIANVGFGFYTLGLLIKAILEMKKATKAKKDPVHQKIIIDSDIWTRADLTGIKKLEELKGFVEARPNKYRFEEYATNSGFLMIKGKMSSVEKDLLLEIFPPKPEEKIIEGLFNQSQAHPLQASRSRSVEELVRGYKSYQRIEERLHQEKASLTIADLEQMKNGLKQILVKFNVMDKKGKITQGVEHPYRHISHEILDVYKAIEMAICIKACSDLHKNSSSQEAREALLGLLKESREYIVIDTAAKMYRRLKLNLSRS